MNKMSRNTNRQSLPVPGTTIRAEVPHTTDLRFENTVLDENLKKIDDQESETRNLIKELNSTLSPVSECPESRHLQMVKFNKKDPRIYIDGKQKIIFNSEAVSKFSLKEGGYAVLFYSDDDLYPYIGIKSSIFDRFDTAAHRLTSGHWPGSLCITCPEFIYLLQLKKPLPVRGFPLNWDPEKQMIWARIGGIES